MIKDLRDITYYSNRIKTAISEYIELNGINPKELSHIEFNALLRYIYNYVPFKSLVTDNNKEWNSIIQRSDIDIIDSYINILMDICIKYDKVVNFRYFNSMYGINIYYINSPNNKNNENEIAYYIHKAVKSERELSLADRCIDKNQVMSLALGKIEFGWNENNNTNVNINVVGSFDSPFKLLDKYNNNTLEMNKYTSNTDNE